MHQAARARLLATLSPEAQAATEPHPPFTVYIMRGIPGAGKSTRAAQIVQETQQANPHRTTAVHSTDVYFYNDRGEWCYDVNLLQVNKATPACA
jgi:pantothenate kinase-related protein Tda10